MVDLSTIDSPHVPVMPAVQVDHMTDGSEIFPYLWRHFLSHQPLRDWLMRAKPFKSASFAPAHISQGIAFCCNFDVPPLWADMAPSFELGEMFVPDHAYSQFMCGSVVAATSLHKHLVCALGPAAVREPARMPSYRTAARRMVVDMGSSRSINIIEFSWMCDGALIVTVKVLVPPHRARPYQSAGCTGAFAVFTDAVPGGPIPPAPRSLVSFVEAPRCPSCIRTNCLGCYCQPSVNIAPPVKGDARNSSATWPPQLTHDVDGDVVNTYHNVRLRLHLIQHIAHVKITAHLVTTHQVDQPVGPPSTTYRLGANRFVVKAVRFRPANAVETDTLRQVADKLRLLRCAALRMAAAALQPDVTTLRSAPVRQVDTEAKQEVIISEDPALVLTNAYLAGSQSPDTSYISFHVGAMPSPPSPTSPTSPHSPPVGVTAAAMPLCVACVVRCVTGDGPRCAACSQANRVLSQTRKVDMSSTPVSTQCTSPAEVQSWLTADAYSKVTDVTSLTPAARAQSPAMRLRCPRCDKTFSQQGSLNRHLKNIHDQRKIPCDYCMMTFGQMFDLKRHQRRKHADKQSTTVRRERIEARLIRIPVGRIAN